ncbi:GntR family transcriptional regulator [Steroidobacter agaridevorans]|uniref:GntR family transcriptional regulator n=2 Tax=Steroidobacter agaridevorans TaxID=2695856 RepID=A0A829YAL2_9GAMM|nr:FadR/GntR family transcriptional regulator [Steroidobacter agaridevorans]GFE80095.1 GntR family transcriptional regulator [Steroidobacter agaridevorans]GFE89935.1 GntR family transcriptional regulator [Steroidobacter agaridevorans]
MHAATPASSVHRRIAGELGSSILCGRRVVGSLLPKEMDATADFGVSRTAYREAVRMLVAKGLVESRPHLGTYVTDRRRWQILDPDVLRWAFDSGPSLSFIQELFELRGILEPHAAELAARRRTAQQLASMSDALEEMARHGLACAVGRAADERFHEELLAATGNQALMTLSASICAAIHWTTYFKYQSHEPPRDAIPDHRKLYAAIVDKDADRAARAAKDLIQLALADTRASILGDRETGARPKSRKRRPIE